MIRCVSTALQRGFSHQISLRKAQKSQQISSLLQKNTWFFSQKGFFGLNAQAEKAPLVQATFAIQKNKDALNIIVKEVMKQYKDDLKKELADESNSAGNALNKILLKMPKWTKRIWWILSMPIKFIYRILKSFFTYLALFIICLAQYIEKNKDFLYSIYKKNSETQVENYKVEKGQAVKKETDSQHNRRVKDQLKYFQCTNTKQQQTIEGIVRFDDSKVLQYIEAFVGNGFTTNLVRNLHQKIKKEKDENPNAPTTNVFIYDFKSPPNIVPGDDQQKWGQAANLHYLLTNLIDKGKKNKSERTFLIVNQVNLLCYAFQNLKPQRLQQLFKQIIYLNKEHIANVILVSGNHYFYDNYLKKLKFADLQDFKRDIFEQLTTDDLEKVIKARMGYYTIIDHIPNKDDNKKKIDKIIEFIKDNCNSVKESMRILKAAGLDAKSQYEDHIKKPKENKRSNKVIQDTSEKQDNTILEDLFKNIKKYGNSAIEILGISKAHGLKDHTQTAQQANKQNDLQHSRVTPNKFLIEVFAPKIICLQEALQKAKDSYQKIILAKQDHINMSIGINEYKGLNKETIDRLTKIQYHKTKLLEDILKQRYTADQQKSSFYLDYDDAKLQAFRQLNNDEILHGFKFVSKTMEKAYQYAVKINPDYLQMKKAYRQAEKANQQPNPVAAGTEADMPAK